MLKQPWNPPLLFRLGGAFGRAACWLVCVACPPCGGQFFRFRSWQIACLSLYAFSFSSRIPLVDRSPHRTSVILAPQS